VVEKSPVPESHMQKNINRIMGNICFKKGAFDKAALYYAKALVPGEEIEGMAVIHRNYAECMKIMNSLPLAIANYQKAIEIYNRESKKYPVAVIIESYMGLGDCLFAGGKYLEAISMYKQSLVKIEGRGENLWSVYSVGKSYAAMKNSGMVNTTFSDLKNKGGEGFWSNIADHALREYSWNEKDASSQQ
jgi:tetratricopeptide (TPR) repeat protein